MPLKLLLHTLFVKLSRCKIISTEQNQENISRLPGFQAFLSEIGTRQYQIFRLLDEQSILNEGAKVR